MKNETSANAQCGRALINVAAPLSGDEVVPSIDTDARGIAKFKLNKAGDDISFTLNVANIDDVFGRSLGTSTRSSRR